MDHWTEIQKAVLKYKDISDIHDYIQGFSNGQDSKCSLSLVQVRLSETVILRDSSTDMVRGKLVNKMYITIIIILYIYSIIVLYRISRDKVHAFIYLSVHLHMRQIK